VPKVLLTSPPILHRAPVQPARPAVVPPRQPVAAPITASAAAPAQIAPNVVERSRPVATASQAAPATPEPAHQPITASVLARQLPIDMALPGEESRWTMAGALRRTKWRGVRRNTARGLAVALVLLITMGGMLFSQGYFKLHKVFKGTGEAAALKVNVDPTLLKGEGSGRVNILLLGRGGGTHDGPDLTDTMMVASVDPVNHTTALLSVPRDLWVTVPGAGDMKINAAYETGIYKYFGKEISNTTDPKAVQAGFALADQTVSSVLGINIDYNMVLDFQAFQQAVDTVGGITVNVPSPLVDPTMAWQNGGNATLANAGVQNFNGAQALLYARSRETTSDFARAVRQRSILVALKSKVETVGTLSNPLKLSGLLNAFGNNVQTDLSLTDAERLYSILSKVNQSSIASLDLDNAQSAYVTTGNMNGQSIVLPTAGLFNYGDIQSYVRAQLPDPYILKEKAKILVLNGTTDPGLATTEAATLKTYGYNVIGTGDTPHTGWTQTTLVDLTHKDPYTKNYLEQRFGQTAATQLADKTINTEGADFVIIIGSDEATTTQP
jgi:LCP family protein required for cell wall assembly